MHDSLATETELATLSSGQVSNSNAHPHTELHVRIHHYDVNKN